MNEYLTDGSKTYRRRRLLSGPWLALAVAAGVSVVAIGLLAAAGLPATLDGSTLMVRLGTTPSDVLELERVAERSGDLLAAKDRRVLRVGGGTAPAITYRGALVPTDAALLPFRAYGIRPGTDIVEPTKTVTRTIEAPVEYRGDGPLETVVRFGRKGVSVTVYGSVSGDVLSSEWVVPARRGIVVRSKGGYATSNGGKVRGTQKLVALTFDDGPDPRYTPAILKILKDNGVKATFFVLSSHAKDQPDLTRRIVAEGHLIANHSRTHRDLTKLKAADLEGEFRRSQEAIASVTGVPPRFFRAPYGITDARVTAEAKRKKLQLVGWEVDSTDWSKPGTATIVKRATPQRNGGMIVLMHDSGGDRRQTVAALPAIIRTYRERGFEFVTVDRFYK